jgi:hypothetical protein
MVSQKKNGKRKWDEAPESIETIKVSSKAAPTPMKCEFQPGKFHNDKNKEEKSCIQLKREFR